MTDISETSNATLTSPIVKNPSYTICAGAKAFVTIRPDGTLEYGEGYTPDTAAKAFWDAMGYERMQRCPPI